MAEKAAIVVVWLLVLVAGVGAADAAVRTPTVVPGPLVTVRLLMPEQPDVWIYTDNRPGHWRGWPVRTELLLSREDRCRSRLDARRVLLGQHVTQGVPRRCMSRWARRHERPDPAPAAR